MKIDRVGIIALIATSALLLSIVSFFVLGEQGLQGVSGDIGLQGAAGVTGPQGLQGVQGISGPIGSPGPRGERGEKGEKGEVGEKGEIGERGKKGDSGTLQMTGNLLLATLSSLDNVAYVDEYITIIGAAFFHDPEIWLFDSNGEWYFLDQAVRNPSNNTFELRIRVPEDASVGVGEIAAKTPDGSATYVTFPILIED